MSPHSIDNVIAYTGLALIMVSIVSIFISEHTKTRGMR